MSRRKNVVANMTEECTVCLMGGLSRFVGQCVLKGESRCALLFKKKLFVLFLLNVSETFSIDCIICYRKYYMEKFTF